MKQHIIYPYQLRCSKSGCRLWNTYASLSSCLTKLGDRSYSRSSNGGYSHSHSRRPA